MPRPSDDDREAVDRAFAALVAGYHLTADRSDPSLNRRPSLDGAVNPASPVEPAETSVSSETFLAESSPPPGSSGTPAGPAAAELPGKGEHAVDSRVEETTLFHFDEPLVPPEQSAEESLDEESSAGAPVLPLPRPAWPVLVAWIAMGFATLAVLAAVMGVPLPRWAGWLALGGFVGGFGLLVSRLPRHRPPDAGDGAVL